MPLTVIEYPVPFEEDCVFHADAKSMPLANLGDDLQKQTIGSKYSQPAVNR